MALDQQSIHHLLGFNLAMATVHTDRVFDACIGTPLALRRVEFTMLSLIEGNAEVTPKRLSTALGLSAPNMSVVLDRLEKRGLLRRERHGSDGRSMVLELTAKGRSTLARAAKVSHGMEDGILAHLSAAERAMLLELLQKVGGSPVK